MEINLTNEKLKEFKKDSWLEIRCNDDLYIYIELNMDNNFYSEIKYNKSHYAFDNEDLEKLDDKDILRWGNGEPRCPSCGTSMIYNFDYCPKCGQKLKWEN